MTTAKVADVIPAMNASNANSSQKSRTTASGEFKALMNQTNTKENSNTYSSSMKKMDMKKNTSDNQVDKSDTRRNVAKKDTKIRKTDNVTEKRRVSDNSKSDKELVNDVAEDIKEELKEALHISDEQLSDIMQILNLTSADLLNNQNILEIIMQQTGTDKLSLFENQDLVDTVKSLMETVQDIKTAVEQIDLKAMKDAANAETDIQPLTDSEKMVGRTMTDSNDTSGQQLQNAQQGVKSGLQNNFSDARQNFSGEESSQGEMAMGNNVFVQNLTQAVSNSQQLSYGTQAEAVDIVNQLVSEIRTTVKADTTQMDLQLNPQSLGKLHISILSKEGAITAQIMTQTETARNAIEGQIATLKEAFENQGIKVEAVEVSVSPQGFDFNRDDNFQRQNQGSKKSKKNVDMKELDSQEMIADEKAEMTDVLRHDGSSVSYSA